MQKCGMRRYQIEHKDGRKWYALRMEDFTEITCDSEARAICESFAKETGNEYRAKVGKVVIYETTNHQFKSNARFDRQLKYDEAMGAVNQAAQDEAIANTPNLVNPEFHKHIK